MTITILRMTTPRITRYAWYRHRPAVVGIAALFAAVALVLFADGLVQRLYLSEHHVTGCAAPWWSGNVPPQCRSQAWTDFVGEGHQVKYMTLALLALAPAAALFGGLPWVTREFETGSFRYTWAQNISPRGWLAGTFGQLALLATVAAALCGAAAGWWLRFAAWHGDIIGVGDPWRWEEFELTPLSMVSWTLLAMALALLLGVTIRRTVPAMAAFVVVYGTVLLFGEVRLRPALLSIGPAVRSGPPLGPSPLLGQYNYYVSDWVTGPGGHVVSIGDMFRAIPRNVPSYDAWLAQHHYLGWTAYQPPGRVIWFQLAWAGIRLAAAALAALGAVWWLRKHPAG